jgi:acetylornithine deacetylase
LLEELVSIPSPNPGELETASGFGEAAIAAYVADFFHPYPVEIIKQELLPSRENVLVRWPRSVNSGEVLWTSHLDTVPAGRMAGPFTPVFKDGKVYGRGACDDKGSLAAMMLAFKALLDRQVPLNYVLSFLGTSDEEYKARGIQHYLLQGGRPNLAVAGEPTELKIVTAQRGGMIFRIKAHGQAAHGSQPDAGINAIYLISDAIGRIRELAAKEYPARVHPLCGAQSINIGKIEGGTEPWIVPDECTAWVDLRWIPGQMWEMLWEEVRAAAVAGGVPVEVERPTWKVSEMDIPLDTDWVECFRAAVEHILGEAEFAGASYTSEAAYLIQAGIPALIFGPGSILQAHSNQEFIELSEVLAAARTLAQFAVQYNNQMLHA